MESLLAMGPETEQRIIRERTSVVSLFLGFGSILMFKKLELLDYILLISKQLW